MTAQQTHEKNLAWIDTLIAQYEYTLSDSLDMNGYDGVAEGLASLRANRKVLERHGPDENGECSDCKNYYFSPTAMPIGVSYPCPTYTDITEGLGIEDE